MKQKRKTKLSGLKKKIGKPPGSLVHVGKVSDEKTKVKLFDFDNNQFFEEEISDLNELKGIAEKPTTSWVNVDGIHNPEILNELGELFNIDSLVLEDIMNTEHRPKVEEYEHNCFIVIKMFYYDENEKSVESEQVSLIFQESVVISFQEKEGDVFDPIRERIRKSLGRVRQKPVDYLAYLLVDIIIDNYFNIIEILSDNLENLENKVIHNPKEELLNEIQDFKRELLSIRKAIHPLREMLRFLSTGQSAFIEKGTLKYYRDAYDHSISVTESIDSYMEITNSVRDLYMSNMSNKMNQIMKVLTIMASLFIPLTFIVGIYGMNFRYMPELDYQYGYFIVWGIMILVTIGMIIFFKRKGWI